MSKNKKELKGKPIRKRSRYDITKILLYCAALAVILIVYYHLAHKNVESTENQVERIDFRRDGEAVFHNEDGSQLVRIDIEIAADSQSRSRGLMYRKSMGDREGMLFIFEQPQIVSMWMRNTYIPLDMIFIDADKKIVDIATDTEPLSERQIVGKMPALFVIEVNAGFAERYGLREGQRVSWY